MEGPRLGSSGQHCHWYLWAASFPPLEHYPTLSVVTSALRYSFFFFFFQLSSCLSSLQSVHIWHFPSYSCLLFWLFWCVPSLSDLASSLLPLAVPSSPRSLHNLDDLPYSFHPFLCHLWADDYWSIFLVQTSCVSNGLWDMYTGMSPKHFKLNTCRWEPSFPSSMFLPLCFYWLSGT